MINTVVKPFVYVAAREVGVHSSDRPNIRVCVVALNISFVNALLENVDFLDKAIGGVIIISREFSVKRQNAVLIPVSDVIHISTIGAMVAPKYTAVLVLILNIPY